MINIPQYFKIHKLPIICGVLIFTAGIAVGWYASPQTTSESDTSRLRLQTGKLTRPLLLGRIDNDANSPSLEIINRDVGKLIEQYQKDQRVEVASIYVRQLDNDAQFIINDEEQYHPASLSKLPMYMAYLKMAQDNKISLEERGEVVFEQDYNIQEIKPKEFPVSGNEYTINELLAMMIRSSDNTGFQLLMQKLEAQDYMRRAYQDHLLLYPFNLNGEVESGLTPRQFSRFLRSLYNTTYIGTENSEKALNLMTQVDYKKGIVAGIPQSVQVAHKYGLYAETEPSDGKIISRQLHDCGIVYKPNQPYLICIMTKSSAEDLATIEEVIATISKHVYENLPTK